VSDHLVGKPREIREDRQNDPQRNAGHRCEILRDSVNQRDVVGDHEALRTDDDVNDGALRQIIVGENRTELNDARQLRVFAGRLGIYEELHKSQPFGGTVTLMLSVFTPL